MSKLARGKLRRHLIEDAVACARCSSSMKGDHRRSIHSTMPAQVTEKRASRVSNARPARLIASRCGSSPSAATIRRRARKGRARELTPLLSLTRSRSASRMPEPADGDDDGAAGERHRARSRIVASLSETNWKT